MMITNILMSCNFPRTFFSYNWKQFYNFTQNVTYSKFVEFSAISDSCISRIFNRAKINNREYRFYNEQIGSSNTANINMDIYWADIITKISTACKAAKHQIPATLDSKRSSPG